MRVLVTGGTGFLGSYLVEDLIVHGHDVAVLARPDSDRRRLSAVRDRVQFLGGTLEDLPALRPAATEFRPDAVAHLAWQGVAGVDRNAPLQAHNIVRTVDLAALAAEVGAKVFVGAGSQAEYGSYPRAVREDDETRPTTLYGKAKLAAAAMAGQIAVQAGMRFAWLRVFSTYGPKDHEHWLIPDMIRKLRAGQRMKLTRCEQLWGFLHARDAAAAFRIVLETPSAAGIFNLGSADAPPLKDTVTLLRSLLASTAELGFGEIAYRPDQVMILQADIARLQALGWNPAIDLPTGLRETVAWYDGTQQS